MGFKIISRDFETVNFDRICRLVLEMQVVRQAPIDDIVVSTEGPPGPDDFDIDGDEIDREYWKRGHRSMTEAYALRMGLGKADASGVVLVESSFLPGLVALCQSLAENHSKVPGVKKGGFLYKRKMVPVYSKGLTLLPGRASEIVGRLLRAVSASLAHEDPIRGLQAAAGTQWDDLDAALSAAERAVYEKARDLARAVQAGRSAEGTTFPLAQASGIAGIAVATRNPSLPKHLFAALKEMEPNFRIAAIVVSNPDTNRIAVLCSNQYPVDIQPVVRALKKRFPKSEFDANPERNSVVWDPRSKTPGPSADDVREIVSKHLGFRAEQRQQPQSTRFGGATLADAVRLRSSRHRR